MNIEKIRNLIQSNDEKSKNKFQEILDNCYFKDYEIIQGIQALQSCIMVNEKTMNSRKALREISLDFDGGCIFGKNPNKPILSSWQSIDKKNDILVKPIPLNKQAKVKEWNKVLHNISIIYVYLGGENVFAGALSLVSKTKEQLISKVHYSKDGGSLLTKLVECRNKIIK